MFSLGKKQKTRPTHRTLLRFECLERRQLLTAVNILQNVPLAGDLKLTGDALGNNITIAPLSIPGEFTITAGTGTSLTLGAAMTPVASPFTAMGVTNAISVNLGGGANSLTFGYASVPTPAPAPVAGPVTITDNSKDTNLVENVVLESALTIQNAAAPAVAPNTVQNTITNVQVIGLLTINPPENSTTTISGSTLDNGLFEPPVPAGTVFAPNNLTVTNCTVLPEPAGDPVPGTGVAVVNLAGTGDTSTSIGGGWIDGDGPAVIILNGAGNNAVTIGSPSVATKIGPTPVPGGGPAPAPVEVEVVNGAGNSFTQFEGENASVRLTVLGSILVDNGAASALPGQSNVVSFDDADSVGGVTIENAALPAGTISPVNETLIEDSNLGLQELPGIPEPVTVENGIGVNTFSMTSVNAACTAPWGVNVNNAFGGPPGNLNAMTVFGGPTTITNCQIGTGAFGPDDGTAGDGFDLVGDNGPKTVTISGSTIDGLTNLDLNAGNNTVTLEQKTQLGDLIVTTGGTAANGGVSGDDSVSINTCNITNGLGLLMGGVMNTVTIVAGTTPGWGTLPNPLIPGNFILIDNTGPSPAALSTLNITTSLFDSLVADGFAADISPTFGTVNLT